MENTPKKQLYYTFGGKRIDEMGTAELRRTVVALGNQNQRLKKQIHGKTN